MRWLHSLGFLSIMLKITSCTVTTDGSTPCSGSPQNHFPTSVTYTLTTCISIFINSVTCRTHTSEESHFIYAYRISGTVVLTGCTFSSICCCVCSSVDVCVCVCVCGVMGKKNIKLPDIQILPNSIVSRVLLTLDNL